MTKRRRTILWSAAILAVLGLTAWLICPSSPPDPVYNGHPLSWWVSAFTRSRADIPDLDSNAVPYLIQSLKARDSLSDRVYCILYPHFPARLQDRLSGPNPGRRRAYFASQFLGSIGPAARPAIPELVREVNMGNDEVAHMYAIDALSNIANQNDAAVIQCFVAASTDKNPSVRSYADWALEKLEPETAASARAANATSP